MGRRIPVRQANAKAGWKFQYIRLPEIFLRSLQGLLNQYLSHAGNAGDGSWCNLSRCAYSRRLAPESVKHQNPDAATRDALLDVLLVALSGVIATNRTLDGLAEWVEARSPEFQDEPIEGAASIRAATVQVMVRYFTSDPLN